MRLTAWISFGINFGINFAFVCFVLLASPLNVASADPALVKSEESDATIDDGDATTEGAAIPKVVVPEMELPPNAGKRARTVPPAGLPATGSWSREQFLAAIEREAARAGMPVEVAQAVTNTESSFNPRVVGADGEIGLMQVLPSTARMMGFSGSLSDLAVPETNIYYGVTYLARAWRLAGGDLCTAVMKYRAGHGETRFSHLSVDYCVKVRAWLTARGFPVVGTVPVATFGRAAGPCGRRCLAGVSGGGKINLAALNDRLNQVVMRASVFNVPIR